MELKIQIFLILHLKSIMKSKEIVKKIFDRLTSMSRFKNFELKKVAHDYFYLFDVEESRVCNLGFSHSRKQNESTINMISYVGLESVNNFTKEIGSKFNLFYSDKIGARTIDHGFIKKSISKDKKLELNTGRYTIYDEKSFELFYEVLSNVITHVSIPFFNKYLTIDDIRIYLDSFDKIEKLKNANLIHNFPLNWYNALFIYYLTGNTSKVNEIYNHLLEVFEVKKGKSIDRYILYKNSLNYVLEYIKSGNNPMQSVYIKESNTNISNILFGKSYAFILLKSPIDITNSEELSFRFLSSKYDSQGEVAGDEVCEWGCEELQINVIQQDNYTLLFASSPEAFEKHNVQVASLGTSGLSVVRDDTSDSIWVKYFEDMVLKKEYMSSVGDVMTDDESDHSITYSDIDDFIEVVCKKIMGRTIYDIYNDEVFLSYKLTEERPDYREDHPFIGALKKRKDELN